MMRRIALEADLWRGEVNSRTTRLDQSRVNLITQFHVHRVRLHMQISDLKSHQSIAKQLDYTRAE